MNLRFAICVYVYGVRPTILEKAISMGNTLPVRREGRS